jgi:predicted metal-dependent peptidase
MSSTKHTNTGITFDAARDKKALEKLTNARIAMLLKQPFFGNLALRLNLVNSDDWLPTLATDGRNFYYNSEFVLKLSDRELIFGFGHEILHCVYAHVGSLGMARQANRDKQLWNVALDFCVNGDLVDAQIGEKITAVEICYDRKYVGWTAEDVYDDIMQNAQKFKQMSAFDDHLEDGDGDEDGDGGDGDEDGDGKGKGRPKIGNVEGLRDEMLSAVLQAAAAAGAGKTPAGVQRYLDRILKPVIDWRSLVEQHIQSQIKSDYTFMRPSRRSFSCDAILPGSNVDTMVELTVAMDMSGSTAPYAKDMVSEVLNIVDSYQDYKLHLFCFDTCVYDEVTITPDNVSDLETYEFRGGGGTDFECVFQHLKDTDQNPKTLIFFTDGYPCGGWGDPDYCDTIWIIHGNDSIQGPFGQTCSYDAAAKAAGV